MVPDILEDMQNMGDAIFYTQNKGKCKPTHLLYKAVCLTHSNIGQQK